MLMKLAIEINHALREQNGRIVEIDRVNENTRYHVLLDGVIPFDMMFRSSPKTYSQAQARTDWAEYRDALYHKYLTLIRMNRLYLTPKPEEDTSVSFAFELEVRESEWSRRCQLLHIPNYFFADCEDFPYDQIQLAIGI